MHEGQPTHDSYHGTIDHHESLHPESHESFHSIQRDAHALGDRYRLEMHEGQPSHDSYHGRIGHHESLHPDSHESFHGIQRDVHALDAHADVTHGHLGLSLPDVPAETTPFEHDHSPDHQYHEHGITEHHSESDQHWTLPSHVI